MPEKKRATPRSRKATARSGLDGLVVFDRLEVGPVKLEPRRLTVPYAVHQGRQSDRTELIYRYDEDVFDPKDPAALNLAAMIGVQVAINYGLFCRSIVFHGPFDTADRSFIRAALENTAREIYVKKFLEANPFLTGPAAELKAEKRRQYVAASVEFPESGTGQRRLPWVYHATDRRRHAVLSSGGKDSLLSHALLTEAGFESHPMFVNESGRHWFTALNAHRHFEANVPHTARVWTNSDRVFPWMLRHMPFVRADFDRLRSDEYPIRLWTVAVFLFGALPLLRKRAIGRLIIGDEFDTTDRRTHEGITHYNGLYDQSRYFDNAMSRYFLRKGWAVSQFSVLRPLSELLIETVLARRYPELQALQMSCHATHTEGDRVKPCGKCEKCRRIVAMLVAVDADPRRCGYTRSQIEDGLKAFAAKGVHQEREGAQHLAWMLQEKGRIKLPESGGAQIKRHPEVMKLRFDPERSPVAGIPGDLRQPLYGILMEYAEGAVRRTGRTWKTFDPLTDPSINDLYSFEATTPRPAGGSAQVSRPGHGYLWAELTWPEAEARLQKMDVALLPVGALEQHGPHLTLDVDAFDADYLARRVAEACSAPRPLVLPLIPYGVSYHHTEFKGTISVSNHTLGQLVYEIGMSAAKNGIRKLIIINGHGDNAPTLSFAAQMINRDARIFVCVDTGETSDVDIGELASTPNDVHAGEIETSTSLAVRPHLVQMDKAEKRIPEFSSRYLNFSSQRGLPWYAHTKRISESGVMGDPTKATAAKGKQMWEIMIAHLVALVEDLKDLSLDEIFQKRY